LNHLQKLHCQFKNEMMQSQVGTVIIKRPAIYGVIGGLADFFHQYAPRMQAPAMQRRADAWSAPRAQNLDAGNFFENVQRRKNAAPRGKKMKRKKPKDVEMIKPKEKNIFDAKEEDAWGHDMAREQGILRPQAQDTPQNTYNREPIDYGY
jgi:hypothetical protein